MCPKQQGKAELLSVLLRKDAEEPGIVSLGFNSKTLLVHVCSLRADVKVSYSRGDSRIHGGHGGECGLRSESLERRPQLGWGWLGGWGPSSCAATAE